MLVDLVVVGKIPDRYGSDELRFALSQLRRSLPQSARIEFADAEGGADLVLLAARLADREGLADTARVLILSQPYLMLAPCSLEHLSGALDEGAAAAYAYSSVHPCPILTPDYCTLRGMERYVARLSDHPVVPASVECFQPLVALMTAKGLRQNNGCAEAVSVPGAFAHDFSGYHQGRREEVIPMLPLSARRVLDVGGGEGGFLEALKAARGCETHLAEFSVAACEIAASRVDRIWPGDFMAASFDVRFDCITFLDVLEHTVRPQQWLTHAVQLLNPDGCVVVSIPNVGHWSVVADLLEGRWDYAPAGIHCITHLRFFTKRGILQLMAEAGLAVVDIRPIRLEAPEWFDASTMGSSLALDRDSLATYAYLVVGKVAA